MTAPQSAAEAEKQADALRAALGETLDQLKTNLKPSSLAREAIVTTRAHTPKWLPRYWRVAQSPIGLAVIGAATASRAGALVAQRRRRGR